MPPTIPVNLNQLIAQFPKYQVCVCGKARGRQAALLLILFALSKPPPFGSVHLSPRALDATLRTLESVLLGKFWEAVRAPGKLFAGE